MKLLMLNISKPFFSDNIAGDKEMALVYEPRKLMLSKAIQKEMNINDGVIRVASGYVKDGGTKEKYHINATFSDETVDRYGDVILASAYDTLLNRKQFFNANNIMLWAHNSRQPPLGNIIEPTFANKSFDGVADFRAALVDPFANTIYQMYEMGTMKAFSVGFRPKIISFDPVKDKQDGLTFIEVELLEVSAVPIPANPSALAKAIGAGIINAEFVEKHFKSFVSQIVQKKTFYLPPQYQNLDFFDGIEFKVKSANSKKEAVCTCKVHDDKQVEPEEKEKHELHHTCRFCGHDAIVKYQVGTASDGATVGKDGETQIVEEKDFFGIKYFDVTCKGCGLKESETLEMELSS